MLRTTHGAFLTRCKRALDALVHSDWIVGRFFLSGADPPKHETNQNPNLSTPNPESRTATRKPQTATPNSQPLNRNPQTPNPKPQTSNPKPHTPHPKPQTPNPKPQPPNPKPQTPNPKPKSSNPCRQAYRFRAKREHLSTPHKIYLHAMARILP